MTASEHMVHPPVGISRSFISTLEIHEPEVRGPRQRARFDRGKLIFIDPAPRFPAEQLRQLASYLVRSSVGGSR